jgi:hypothetical protein
VWDINRYTVLAFGVLVADQTLDMFIELVLPMGASVMLIADWLGITRYDGPSGGALDTNGFFTLLAILLIPLLCGSKCVRFQTRYAVLE